MAAFIGGPGVGHDALIFVIDQTLGVQLPPTPVFGQNVSAAAHLMVPPNPCLGDLVSDTVHELHSGVGTLGIAATTTDPTLLT